MPTFEGRRTYQEMTMTKVNNEDDVITNVKKKWNVEGEIFGDGNKLFDPDFENGSFRKDYECDSKIADVTGFVRKNCKPFGKKEFLNLERCKNNANLIDFKE